MYRRMARESKNARNLVALQQASQASVAPMCIVAELHVLWILCLATATPLAQNGITEMSSEMEMHET